MHQHTLHARLQLHSNIATKTCNTHAHGYACNLHAVNCRCQLHTVREIFYKCCILHAHDANCFKDTYNILYNIYYTSSFVDTYYAKFLPTYISMPLNIAQKVSHYAQ